MLELDLLLVPFFDAEFSSLPERLKLTFVMLLEQDDPDLLMWFSHKGEPEDAALAELIRLILDRVQP